jgi:hypothetical protein
VYYWSVNLFYEANVIVFVIEISEYKNPPHIAGDFISKDLNVSELPLWLYENHIVGV